MAFTSYRPLTRTDADVEFLTEVGRLVALAVEATLARQELAQANERLAELTARLAREKDYLEEEMKQRPIHQANERRQHGGGRKGGEDTEH